MTLFLNFLVLFILATAHGLYIGARTAKSIRESDLDFISRAVELLDSGSYSVDEFVEDIRMRIKILKENKK